MFGEFDRESHPFGMATYCPVIEPHTFELLDPEEQQQLAENLGYSEGCPIPQEVIAQKGPFEAAKRYSTLSRLFQLLQQRALAVNPKLSRQIAYPVPRLSHEKPGKFEVDAIPTNYDQWLPPKCTPFGFAAPRILDEVINLATQRERLPTLTELCSAYQLVDRVAEMAETPQHFLAILAETVIERRNSSYQEDITIPGVDPSVILRHLYSRSLLQEQGCLRDLNQLMSAINMYAPTVAQYYDQLSAAKNSDQKRRSLGIF